MLNLVEKYKEIISDFIVNKYIQEGSLFSCRIFISFINGSILEIKDYRFANGERKYSYHWMNNKKKLLLRWDNAPHWENISTFPHHKHKGKIVYPSIETTIEQVLEYIYANIKQKNIN
ncbi:MAG TPA: hypothetical protein DEH02_14015 [Bacteroidales bacterium]|nr:hypothetical protein [Bacteroidales bacterium]